MLETPVPEKTLPRVSRSFGDFIRACREGRTDTTSSIDYSARLTEFTLPGNLAHRGGEGKAIEWDGLNMRITNLPELNRILKQEYR